MHTLCWSRVFVQIRLLVVALCLLQDASCWLSCPHHIALDIDRPRLVFLIRTAAAAPASIAAGAWLDTNADSSILIAITVEIPILIIVPALLLLLLLLLESLIILALIPFILKKVRLLDSCSCPYP